jgi:hypothetical protein
MLMSYFKVKILTKITIGWSTVIDFLQLQRQLPIKFLKNLAENFSGILIRQSIYEFERECKDFERVLEENVTIDLTANNRVLIINSV